MNESTRETTVFLVRHPVVHAESKGICYGDIDVPLEDGWESTLESLASTLGAICSEDEPRILCGRTGDGQAAKGLRE